MVKEYLMYCVIFRITGCMLKKSIKLKFEKTEIIRTIKIDLTCVIKRKIFAC